MSGPDQSDAEWQRLKRYEGAALEQEVANNRSLLNAVNLTADADYYGPAWNGGGEFAADVQARRALSVSTPRAFDDFVLGDTGTMGGPTSNLGPGRVVDDARALRDYMVRDDPDLRAFIADQFGRGRAAVAPLGTSPQRAKLDMEGSDGPIGKDMRNDDGYWRDKGRFSKSPSRYDPVADRSGAGGKSVFSIDLKWEDKQVIQAQPFGDFGDDLLVLRGFSENTGKLQFSMAGAEASLRLGFATEFQYAKDSFQIPDLDKAEVSVRSVVDVGAEGKLELRRRSGGISGMFKAEAVLLQAQGVAESSTLQLPGGAEGKVKAVGVLNAVAAGGSGKAYIEYEN